MTITLAFSQEHNWKKEISKDGNVTVKSDIINTEEGKHIYYIAETITTDINLNQAETYLRNVSNYKKFLENTDESKKVNTIDENTWISYFYFDAPWPMPNSDAVQKFTLKKTNSSLTITGKSQADAYKKTDVDRMKINNITYHFEKIDERTIKVNVISDFEPIGSVPEFLLKGWFPKGPANIVKRLISGASKE